MRAIGVDRGMRLTIILCGLFQAIGTSGCALGPKALEKTHGRYQDAVRHVDEEQLLRNLVQLRYGGTPVHLDVSSIASQYELAGSAEARPFFLAPNPSGMIFKNFTSILPDLSVSGANRPTITLIPANSSEAVRRFLTPIPPETLAFLSETSWPVSVILRLWVERLNGVPNAVTASGPSRGVISDFERFRRVADLIQFAEDHEFISVRTEARQVAVGGPVPAQTVTAAAVLDAAKAGMEYRPSDDGRSWILVRKENKLLFRINPPAIGAPELDELIDILNLTPGELTHDIVVAPGNVPDPMLYPRPPSSDLRITPRSTSQVFFYLSNGVEVPCEHLEAGIVHPTTDAHGRPLDGRELTRGLFEVHACKGHKPPPTAFLAVKNRGYWFYIDDRDQASKSTLSLVIQLSRLDFG
ncbi:MAG: hypothetical protein JO161_08595, partial [Planctomycetaceae bacterium]|nr:hypothetical protein [Planctomycetaceae bacterium]